MTKIRANGIEIEYEDTGPRNGIPFLFINGFGSQMTSWPVEFHHALEAKGITPLSAESEYVAQNLVELPEDQATEVLKLVDTLEQDDDVQKVFHNLG